MGNKKSRLLLRNGTRKGIALLKRDQLWAAILAAWTRAVDDSASISVRGLGPQGSLAGALRLKTGQSPA